MTETNITALDPKPSKDVARRVSGPGLDLEGMWRLCAALAHSTLLPPSYMGDKQGPFDPKQIAGNCYLAVTYGHEIGLSPSQSIQGIAIIHGKASVYAETLIAVLRGSGVFDGKAWKETVTGKGENLSVKVVMARTDGETMHDTVTMEQAKLAGWTSNSLYRTQPADMLAWRGRHRVAKLLFADVLKGVTSAEEQIDLQYEVIENKVVDVSGEPETAPAEVTQGTGGFVSDRSGEFDQEPKELDPDLQEVMDNVKEVIEKAQEPEGEPDESPLTEEEDALFGMPPGNEFEVPVAEDADGIKQWSAWFQTMETRFKGAMSKSELEALGTENKPSIDEFGKVQKQMHERLRVLYGECAKKLA